MGTTRYVLRRSSRAKLNFAQQQELWLGVCRDSSAFENEAHARVAWARHKGRIMELGGRNGRRPVAWWHFEKGLRHPGIEHERSILFEFPEFADVLSADERAELEAYWRKEFERSWGPNFSFYADGRIYSGDAARWQHWLFVDLPPPLLDQLMAERERRGRVIDELEEASQQEEAVAETNSSPENERCGPPPIRG